MNQDTVPLLEAAWRYLTMNFMGIPQSRLFT